MLNFCPFFSLYISCVFVHNYILSRILHSGYLRLEGWEFFTMLYELVGIARVPMTQHNREAADVVRHIGKLVLNNRGVIRNVDNWGVRYLPKIWNKNREAHILGAHFYMKFDASPAVQREVQRALQADARMLRSTIVKLGGEDLPSLLEKRTLI